MSRATKFPTIPYEPGDGDKNVSALRSMSRAATGRSSKGPLPDEHEPDVVTVMEWSARAPDELDAMLDWATRDVPEES